MRKAAKWFFIILLVAIAVAQFVGPKRTNPSSDPAMAIHAQTTVPPEVTSVLDRSCKDCHSNHTRWPWYSTVAPVKWVLVRDVEEGRKHLNFLEWGSYTAKKQEDKLGDICEMVSMGDMPIKAYTFLHRDAKLSPAQVETLCAWTEAELAKMKAAQGAGQASPAEKKEEHRH